MVAGSGIGIGRQVRRAVLEAQRQQSALTAEVQAAGRRGGGAATKAAKLQHDVAVNGVFLQRLRTILSM